MSNYFRRHCGGGRNRYPQDMTQPMKKKTIGSDEDDDALIVVAALGVQFHQITIDTRQGRHTLLSLPNLVVKYKTYSLSINPFLWSHLSLSGSSNRIVYGGGGVRGNSSGGGDRKVLT